MKLHFRLLTSLALGVLAAALAPFSRGAEGYSGDMWAFLDPAKVISAASKVSKSTYPGCDEVIVDQKMVRSYLPDGTGRAQDETWVKVLTERGKDDERVQGLGFMLPYSNVEFVRLEVVGADGKVTPVDIAANSKESIDQSQMDMNIYDPNMKVLQVNIPQLDPGDVVHVVTRETTLRPIIEGAYSDEFMLEGPGAIVHTSVEIHAPASRKLERIFLRDPVDGTVVSSRAAAPDGGEVYRWEVNRVPRMYDEPSMPSYRDVLQRILVSTLPDWKDVSRWYWNLAKDHLDASSPAMKREVETLTAGAPDALAKAKAIFYYVSKNIRYMGVTTEKDRPGFEPHDVSMTFDKKYGVCRDKAALLVSMLRMAGLEAYPVLTNVGSKCDPGAPNPDFNHAIAAVCLKPGEYTLMDATDENTRDLLPASESDQSYLVCRPGGDILRTSPVPPPGDNMLTVRTTGTLSASGHLEATSALEFGGINDNEFRSAMATMKPDARRELFEKFLNRAAPGAVIKDLRIEPANMLDTSVPVHAEIDYAADGVTATGGGASVVGIPWVGRDFAIVNYLLRDAGLKTRKYPLRLPSTCGIREDVSLRLGTGYSGPLALPHFTPVDDPGETYSRTESLKDGVLSCSMDFELKAVEFPPEGYLALKRTLAAMDYDNRKSPVLAVSGGAAAPAGEGTAGAAPKAASDVRVLESSHTYLVQDARDWTLTERARMRILTYNGKKKNSEQKIPYNPACQEVRLVHAFVVAPDGSRQDVSENEVHRMDAAWNPGAGRYTGGKVLVVNLPGVEVGSVIDMEFQVRCHDMPFFAGFEPFQLGDEVSAKLLRIQAPAGLALHTLVTGPAGMVAERSGSGPDGDWREWTASDVGALPDEPSLPPAWTYRAGVVFFAGDLADYTKRLGDAMAARAAASPKASEMARGLIAGAAGEADAVRIIRDYIARAIRRAGPGNFLSLPLSELSDADTTLRDGYGDSADIAILYHAMLSAAGFKPAFVLASALPPVPGVERVVAAIPLPGAFTEPLVSVSAGGGTCYLNDTDEYARLGTTPHEGRLALSLPGASPAPVRTAPDDATRVERFFDISLADSGNARISIRTAYYGKAYDEKRRYFAEVTPEDRRHYFEDLVSSISQDARPVGGLSAQFDGYPGVEAYTVEVNRFAIADGKFEYFPIPGAPGIVQAPGDRRELPFFVDDRDDERLHLTVELPSGHDRIVIAPEARDLSEPDGAGEVRITRESSSGRLSLTYDAVTAPAIVQAGSYRAIKDLAATLNQKSSRVILLEAAEKG